MVSAAEDHTSTTNGPSYPASSGWFRIRAKNFVQNRDLARSTRERRGRPVSLRRMRSIGRMLAAPPRALLPVSSLRVGAWADLVLFDAASIADGATFDEPHEGPRGIRMVLVKGHVAVANGQPTTVRAGVVLRHRSKAKGL